jgi:hypothetical protein
MLAVACALIGFYHAATHYCGWLYRGGRIVNYGLFSRPQYEAHFAPVTLDAAGAHEYSFSRFPAEDATPMLLLPRGLSSSSIERLTTSVRLRVVGQNDQVLCDATGSPSERGHDRLVVTSSADVIGLWHAGCVHLRLRTCGPCRLIVSIGQVDPATPGVQVVPTIRGGGWELP